MENEGKQRKFAVPGDGLGSEMEYLPGKGTFAEKDEIYSTLTGNVNDEARTLSVNQARPLTVLGTGAVIVGSIENIVEPIALVRVQVGASEGRFGDNPDYAVLHASMIKRGYVKNVRDEYKIGDIIRAKIADIRNGEMRLATDADDLGAIKAFCGKCRHPMKAENGSLECEDCGWKDNRKIAQDYRKTEK